MSTLGMPCRTELKLPSRTVAWTHLTLVAQLLLFRIACTSLHGVGTRCASRASLDRPLPRKTEGVVVVPTVRRTVTSVLRGCRCAEAVEGLLISSTLAKQIDEARGGAHASVSGFWNLTACADGDPARAGRDRPTGTAWVSFRGCRLSFRLSGGCARVPAWQRGTRCPSRP